MEETGLSWRSLNDCNRARKLESSSSSSSKGYGKGKGDVQTLDELLELQKVERQRMLEAQLEERSSSSDNGSSSEEQTLPTIMEHAQSSCSKLHGGQKQNVWANVQVPVDSLFPGMEASALTVKIEKVDV